jgi:uncharacterized protein
MTPVRVEQFAYRLLPKHIHVPRSLNVILHHSGPVDRSSYAYMHDLLLPEGHAVFPFAKRGNGAGAGVYSCCEAADALAAYRAAIDAFERPTSP